MASIKALILGLILTYVLSGVLAFTGATGGTTLAVHHQLLAQHTFYWSWPLFLLGTALIRLIMVMMPS